MYQLDITQVTNRDRQWVFSYNLLPATSRTKLYSQVPDNSQIILLAKAYYVRKKTVKIINEQS